MTTNRKSNSNSFKLTFKRFEFLQAREQALHANDRHMLLEHVHACCKAIMFMQAASLDFDMSAHAPSSSLIPESLADTLPNLPSLPEVCKCTPSTPTLPSADVDMAVATGDPSAAINAEPMHDSQGKTTHELEPKNKNTSVKMNQEALMYGVVSRCAKPGNSCCMFPLLTSGWQIASIVPSGC